MQGGEGRVNREKGSAGGVGKEQGKYVGSRGTEGR